jgi:hypothetical protein
MLEVFDRIRRVAPELCSLEEVQRRHVKGVLKAVNDNKAHAAEILGIGRTTLYRILEENEVLGNKWCHTKRRAMKHKLYSWRSGCWLPDLSKEDQYHQSIFGSFDE